MYNLIGERVQKFLEDTERVTCKHVHIYVSRSLPLKSKKVKKKKKENTGKKRPGGVKLSSFGEGYEQDENQEQSFWESHFQAVPSRPGCVAQ